MTYIRLVIDGKEVNGMPCEYFPKFDDNIVFGGKIYHVEHTIFDLSCNILNVHIKPTSTQYDPITLKVLK